MRVTKEAATAVAAVAASLAHAGCGGGTAASAAHAAKPPATPTTAAPTTAATTVPATTSTTAAAAAGGSSSGLPTGAATGFPFGSTTDSSDGSATKISLLPPNADGVNQSAVAAAPKLGPFNINPNAGPSGWPDACTLTNIAQLKALEPAITGLSGDPQGAKAEILGSGGNTPNNTQCKYNLTTSFDPGNGYPPSWVQVQFNEIDPGAPDQYQSSQQEQASQAAKYPAQYANYPSLANGVKCFDDGNDLQCLKGDVSYWISGQKVTGGSNSGADQAVWIDQIELPLAEVLGGEITGS